jgi:hypothetical protein
VWRIVIELLGLVLFVGLGIGCALGAWAQYHYGVMSEREPMTRPLSRVERERLWSQTEIRK